MSPKRNQSPQNRKGSIALADCVFPEEIMLCILTRLPVKSILRFKSVCKPWGDLFSSREFMKMHQGQYSSDPKNQSIIIHNYADDMSLFEIESDETKPTILGHPHPKTRRKEIVGCCNGLICLSRPHLGPGNIVLWNPAMKLFKYARISENERFTDTETVSLGFGYDDEGDDYKVVRIVCFNGDDVGVWVEVYSVNTDSWVTIEPEFDFRVFLTENTVIVNGNPYWVAEVEEEEEEEGFTSELGEFLVGFDVRRMKFKAVPLYSRNHDSNIEHATFMDWKGSLGSLVCTRDSDKRVESLHVLVFDDGEEIWRKFHTFRTSEVNVGRVLESSKNGKMLCSKDGRLFVFDPETGWVKVYENERLLSMIHPHVYTERLTCIQGMESDAEKEENCFWEGPSNN